MNKIRVSFDTKGYTSKPVGKDAAEISPRIGKHIRTLHTPDDLYSFVKDVGQHGHTFSPATFLNGKRNNESFEQMQLLVLDFDDTISYRDVCDRASRYELPILAAYDTFSSTEHNRFRVMFLNNTSIDNKLAAKTYKNALLQIFPESDKTDCDISKMYYGGKELLYFDRTLPTIDPEALFRNMTCFLKDKCGDTNYKRSLKSFAQNNGIRLNSNGLLDISVQENPTEFMGTSIDKNSPDAFIFYKSNGENLSNIYYQIHLSSEGTPSSVGKSCKKNHAEYRSDLLHKFEYKCNLFKEFTSGCRRLHHNELFGLSTNLIHIETGTNLFLNTYSKYYDSSKLDKWKFYLKYTKSQNYNPQNCDMFCAYSDNCRHGKNILTTVSPKKGTIERLANYEEHYSPIEEVEKDLYDKLQSAINSHDTMWHIIKAQTSIGKTEAYLNLMKSMSDKRFLIAVPTNKLKQDVKSRADEKEIPLMTTPSLDEIKDELPDYVWEQIQLFRNIGQHLLVHSYLNKIAEKENSSCLKKYLKHQKQLEKYEGSLITTHRRLLNMDQKRLRQYDAIIIDEDIILGSIASDQCELPVSVLKKIMNKAREKIRHKSSKPEYVFLFRKLRKILEQSQETSFLNLPSFQWDSDSKQNFTQSYDDLDRMLTLADIPSLCLAKRCIYRRAAEDRHLTEDSIVFLKPYDFKNLKYIMVSATADKDICEYCFGKQKVKFYECKQARYTGTLNQYFSDSMSRHHIDQHPSILKKISESSGFQHMITFKKYSVGDMYFGNAIGCDYLKGQDIDVVGTPYQIDFLYKLLPFSLNLNIDENAVMKSCKVTHNGYIFTFTTYGEEHDILRKFHFWMIESELEQAVGRARLLRYRCTVNLYSNFPLRQAVMKESKYDLS